MSNDFPESGPLAPAEAMLVPNLRVSKSTVARQEVGDRAIEPLYPSFFSDEGVNLILTEPHLTRLLTALKEALTQESPRSITARALMQVDAWAAYDVIFAQLHGKQTMASEQVMSLLARFIRKLSLTDSELKQLKTNFIANDSSIPDLFNPQSGWIEIELLPHREHDFSVDFRRAARVFIKVDASVTDKAAFLESLKYKQDQVQLKAVALIIQDLLIDKDGNIKPSPLISDLQIRDFQMPRRTTVRELELSRRELLSGRSSSGFVESTAESPAYLVAAGNDYDFATPLFSTRTPVVAHLKTRCSQCHGASGRVLMSFALQDITAAPHTRILDPTSDQRADYVIGEKVKRPDFLSLPRR